MTSIRRAVALLLAGIAVAANGSPSLAKSGHGRFSNAPSYAGEPNLPLALSLVVAGGGPSSFDATKLVRALAGAKTSAEVASLQTAFGAEGVESFLDVFDFVVDDSLDKLAAAKIPLPTTPEPAATDARALVAALYAQGVDARTNRFDVEYLLDGLVTHRIHVAVMNDVDAKYGTAADANYHAVLARAMTDLATDDGAIMPRVPDGLRAARETRRATAFAVAARRRRGG